MAAATRRRRGFLLLATVFVAVFIVEGEAAVPRVRAIMVFGDSLLDAGNNDYLDTAGKADFPPYGRDFRDHVATGRFSNGKMMSDIIGEKLGFTSPAAAGESLLIGANFASGRTGYYDDTANRYNVLSLSQQLEYFKEYQSKLAAAVGGDGDGDGEMQAIVAGSLVVISLGSNDFGLNYYINPLLRASITFDDYCDFLMAKFDGFITKLYGMGVWRIGVMSVPPFGCFPATNTLFVAGSANPCVAWLNEDARRFNLKLRAAVRSLSARHDGGLRLAVLDIYTPLHDLVVSHASRGFTEASRGCCGTGKVEFALLCNRESPGTCPDAATYVFWDAAHMSEAACQVIVDSFVTTLDELVA